MMKTNIVRIAVFVCVLVLSSFGGCMEALPVQSPPGYDLTAPKKYVLGYDLREISGIVFLRGNADTLYAEEDEDGKLFYFHPGDPQYNFWKFGKRGDYEDVTILNNNEFVLLRSDGSLSVFPVALVREGVQGKKERASEVREYEHILPQGEYEGLFGDDDGKLVALCKNCPEDDQRDEVSGYALRYDAQHNLAVTEHFKVDVSGLKLTSINRKVRFHPSCLARHPMTREWYILSSVNKVLLVLDDKWKVKASYPLNPSLFKQPEGLAFDRRGNMYISNEGAGGDANVLLFNYKR
jgi:SdiA-regulated